VEFDSDHVYITNNQEETEKQIPLHDVIKLNARPYWGYAGGERFTRYSLHYIDEYKMPQKVKFLIFSTNKHVGQFISLVKSKNPSFKEKNWTHTFDWWDR
jgi:hypothetical protein